MRWGWLAATAAVLTGNVALAHELACDKRVNGELIYEIQSYPATLEWTMTVRNVHRTSASDVEAVEDRLLTDKFGWAPQRTPPYRLAFGESHREVHEHRELVRGMQAARAGGWLERRAHRQRVLGDLG
ncbi:hypothetical protein [Myxococcus sp. CA056]|uniref:hypothetical protein n=1 Tax=Myxococcus sp. CA056 TaxID=2741740 RepID=UPI001C2DAF4C|nr:hypothetical protein [Myxococcus sp. CA056]